MAPQTGQELLQRLNGARAWALNLHNVSWWVGLVGALVGLANALFPGLGLDPARYQSAVELMASLIVGTAIAVHGVHQAPAPAAVASPKTPDTTPAAQPAKPAS